MRASFGIAFQFRYAYNLIARNGVLFDGLGGILHDQVDALDHDDVLIAISQSPYSAPTVEAVNAAAKRGVTIVALTDSSALATRPPCNAYAAVPHRIAVVLSIDDRAAALVELLLARLAARGGKPVLERLAEVQQRLAAAHAYWPPGKGAT